MHILILNQFFWPDAAATSQHLTDLVRHLAGLGRQVTVICGSSSYHPSKQTSPAPPARIVRVREWPFSRRLPSRLLSYGTFLVAAAWRALLAPKPDLVLTMTTPPGLSLIGTLLKGLRGVRHVNWEMDLYPDVAVGLAMVRPRNPLVTLARWALDFGRRHADATIALGECMRDRLIGHGLLAGRIRVSEVWTDGRPIQVLPFPPPEPLRILYSGNLGMAHEIETILAVLDRLKSDPRFEFVFQGGGPRRAELERFCAAHHISNVTFAGYRPMSEMAESLGGAHVGLVTQCDATLGTVVPSKMYTFMAAGRPVLFIGPEESTAARAVRRFGCGWQVRCGDTAALAALLESLASHFEKIQEAGKLAREAFSSYYDLPIGVQRMAEAMGA
jgi:glycosyltransferase involved in cell wall biosynthesis